MQPPVAPNATSPSPHCDLAILGASARAAAQSAIRAGLSPWCADLFADRDLCAMASVARCERHDYPHGLLDLMERADLPRDTPVVLTGAVENHPQLIEAIVARRPLAASPARAIEAVRDPAWSRNLPPHRGLSIPAVHKRRATSLWAVAEEADQRYLLKPRRGAGGRGIRTWHPGERVDSAHYLQQQVPGTPVCAVYGGEGASTRLFGVTEQLTGDAAFGASAYQYCGSVGPVQLSAVATEALMHLGCALSEGFGLSGVFGVDAVIDGAGTIWPVEVNPRYTASIEVLERAGGPPVLQGVVERLPRRESPRLSTRSDVDLPSPGRRAAAMHAKAIVFARRVVQSPDLYERFDAGQIADVPWPGTTIDGGWPVCTLMASGADRDTCHRTLRQMASRLYDWLEP